MKTLTGKTIALTLAALGAAGAAHAQSLLFERYGLEAGDQLGNAVEGGADFDLDGLDDLVYGVPFRDTSGLTNNGLVRVVSAKTGQSLFSWEGDASYDEFGWSVAIAGDVNDDGWPDIAVGAPNAANGAIRPGMARVLSGQDGTTLYTVYGDDDDDEFGYSVTGKLNWDGDTFADFAVGAPNGDTPGVSIDPGYCRIFAGSSGAVLQMPTSGWNFARWGEALCGEGDVNGDGINDLIVGAPVGGLNDGGQVKVMDGSTKLQMWEWFGDSPGDRFGAAVASRLDPDGDGYDEVLVGVPDDDGGGTDAGSVWMLDGQSGAVVHTWNGENAFDRLGAALTSCADLDHDGRRDVIAGAPQETPGGLGSVRALGSGTLAELMRLHGEPDSHFGRSVASAGNFNGDGTPDFVAGGHLADDPEPVKVDAGMVRVFSGGAPGFVSYCTAGISASGCQAKISGSGLPSATTASGFVLSAVDVEGGKNGQFFYGASGRQANSWGNGTSFQCVVPPVKRGGILTGVGANGTCDGVFDQDLNARWCPTCPKPSHNFGAGAVVQAQLWYRDHASTSNQTTSLSDAIEFVIAP
jgi:hypothetical protein